MKYEMELTLIIRGKSNENGLVPFDVQSIDKVVGSSLSSILGQFLIVIASVHQRLLNDCKLENRVIDDDIPF